VVEVEVVDRWWKLGEVDSQRDKKQIKGVIIYSSGHVGRLQVVVMEGTGQVREMRADGCEGGKVKLDLPPYESIFV
jgi:hypothetical protein